VDSAGQRQHAVRNAIAASVVVDNVGAAAGRPSVGGGSVRVVLWRLIRRVSGS
jgi:hypothetical protein